jgi:hypothetical protein
MAMDFTPMNVLQFYIAVSPLLLGFFMVMVSVFNQDVKGLVYLGCVLLSTLVYIAIMYMFKSKSSPHTPTCDILTFNSVFAGSFDVRYLNTKLFAYNSMFIIFTLVYLLVPMHYYNHINYLLLIFLGVMFLMDGFYQLHIKCVNWAGILGAAIIGGGVALGLATAIVSQSGDLIFFNEIVSNNVICKRPTEQSFKCSVYKNGELLASSS